MRNPTPVTYEFQDASEPKIAESRSCRRVSPGRSDAGRLLIEDFCRADNSDGEQLLHVTASLRVGRGESRERI